MPAAGSTGQRRSGPLPSVLFWSGVGLAPLAALLLLIGQGSLLLPVGAVLALLAGVLLAVSITLRSSGVNVKSEIEQVVFDEIDGLRDDIRDDISHAARATHKSLADRIVALSDTVDALRGQIDVMRGQLERAASAPPPQTNTGQHQAAPGGMLRHTETVQVTTRQTTLVDPNEAQRDGTVYGSRHSTDYAAPRPPSGADYEGRAQVSYQPPAPQIPQQRRPPERIIEASPREESWTEQLLRERLAHRDPDRQPVERSGEWTPERRTGEWSSGRRREGVTTDRLAANPDGGERWTGWSSPRQSTEPFDPERTAGGRRASDPEETTGRRRAYDPEETGGRGFDPEVTGGRRRGFDPEQTGGRGFAPEVTGGRQRGFDPEVTGGQRRGFDPELTGGRQRGFDPEETGGRRRAYDPEETGGRRPAYDPEETVGRRRASEPDNADDRVTGLRTTDRWASVRSDERGGRELQMGERRTAMHEDGRGTEVRIEDRWAAVRREEARREATERQEGPRRSAASRERERDWGEPTEWSQPQRGAGRAALPAGPAERSGEWSKRGRTGEWSPAERDEDRSADDRPAGRYRVDDTDYRWNGARDASRGGQTGRRLVDFEGTDDRWR
jgi:hypothetical protein